MVKQGYFCGQSLASQLLLSVFTVVLQPTCGVGGKISDSNLSKISKSQLRLSKISNSGLYKFLDYDSDSLT